MFYTAQKLFYIESSKANLEISIYITFIVVQCQQN